MANSEQLSPPVGTCHSSKDIFGSDSEEEDDDEEPIRSLAAAAQQIECASATPLLSPWKNGDAGDGNAGDHQEETAVCAHCSLPLNGVWFGNGKFCSAACKKKNEKQTKSTRSLKAYPKKKKQEEVKASEWSSDHAWVGTRVRVLVKEPGKTSTRSATKSISGKIVGWVPQNSTE